MNGENKTQPEYDEIDLMDYLKIVIKRKWLILVIFLAAVIAAGVFSFFIAPKIYKIDTSLEIGTTRIQAAEGLILPIEEPIQLVEKIEGDVYRIPGEGHPKIKAENPKGTRLIKNKIESSVPEGAKNILTEINNLILAEHQEKIKAEKELINNNIKTTEGKIQLTENDIERTRNKIKPIESDIERIENKIEYAEEEKKNLEAKIEALEKVLVYEQTPGTQFALFDAKEKLANKKQEIEDLFLGINSLKRDKENVEIQINSLGAEVENLRVEINSLRVSLEDIKPTRVLKRPTISEKPIKPRPLLNIAIAGVLGLFVGTFLAFGKEWWEKSKPR